MAVSVGTGGGPLDWTADIDLKSFSAKISRMETELRGLTTTSKEQASGIDNLVKKTVGAIAAYASIATATNFIGDIVRVRGEFQQLEVAFRTMLGSKEKADKLMAQAVALAAITPFTLQDVASGAKQLLAYGFAADDVTATLSKLGDVASGVGAPLNDIVYLYGTLQVQGRAYTRDILQFTQRGIPIIGELAKQFGVTKDQVKDLVEAGKVGFPEVEAAFNSLTGAGGLFFNLMEQQSKTLTGQLSNLSDAWSRMLNDMGKSQEGLFSNAIGTATDIVNNYKQILDIIQKLILVYGTYRAAIILTSVAQGIATAAAKGYTIAQILQYNAMIIAERVMKILNRTMLSNPFVLVATAIAALVAALAIFNRAGGQAAKIQKTLNDVSKEAQKNILAEKTNLNDLVNIARDELRSKESRLAAIKKINEISPTMLGNITLENLRTREGITAINDYIKALDRKAIAQAVNTKKQEFFLENIELQARLDEITPVADKATKKLSVFLTTADKAALIALKQTKEEIDANTASVDALNKKYKEQLAGVLTGEDDEGKAIERTVAVIDDKIKLRKQEQEQHSSIHATWKLIQKDIDDLEAERLKITGPSKKSIEAATNAIEERAEKLKDLQKEIEDAERESRRSGLIKEDAEIDRINARYDELKQKAISLKAGLVAINRIEAARTVQVGNERQKQEFELFKKQILDQKQIFDDFEKYKNEVGIEKARELLGTQGQDFETFIEDLRSQLDKLRNDTSLGGQLKLTFVTDQLAEAEKAQLDKETKLQVDHYKELISNTVTYNSQRLAINKKYDDLQTELDKNQNLPDFQERRKILEDLRKTELNDLENNLARQSDLYKLLNEDIIRFTREQLKTRVKDLQKIMKESTTLTPEMKAALENYIKQLQDLLKATSETKDLAEGFNKISERLSTIGSDLSSMAGAVRGLNADLADTIEGLSDIANVGASAFGAAASFAAGDIAGGVSGVLQTITGIITSFAKQSEAKKQLQQDILDFQNKIILGEFEINELYRDRAREQVKLNKLRIDGLKAEKDLLEKQKLSNAQAFQDIFKKLQAETFVSGLGEKKRSTFGENLSNVLALFGGKRAKAVEITESLAGRSFEDMEKLFTQGQLTGKAKELFELLQRIKKEGVDIDSLLAQNAETAREAFTGTTADSITDSILQGFAAGKRGAADFADDFEQLMKNAVLQSLKMQALEGPLKEFFEAFAASSESDSMLSDEEIQKLKAHWASIIDTAGKKFDDLQKIANLGNTGAASGPNLTVAMKSMTEQTGELLAGQFGGLRLTAFDQLTVARGSLQALQDIQANTGLTAQRCLLMYDRMQYFFETVGVKIR